VQFRNVWRTFVRLGLIMIKADDNILPFCDSMTIVSQNLSQKSVSSLRVNGVCDSASLSIVA
jgi:hypothetical protein